MEKKKYLCAKGFFLYLLCIVGNARMVNQTNILYQYSMLCGPEVSSDSNETGLIPSIPDKYKLCPKCRKNPLCYRYDECCPDTYVQFPPLECHDVTIFDNQNKHLHLYELVLTCPTTASYDTVDYCTKSYDVHGQIRHPPVTSQSTGLTFKNAFCAKCHNISDVVPWKISIHNTCGKKFDLYTIDDMISTIMEDNCSTVTFSPGNIDSIKTCMFKDQKDFVDKCNITGTWKKYDHDIDFACNNFGNKFKFYKNIFCYICNPPYKMEVKMVVSLCNVTGKWETYDKRINDACLYGGSSEASYPFKNMYCYICNMDMPAKTEYFQRVTSMTSFQYYFFNKSNGYYAHNGSICGDVVEKEVEYHKSYTKLECASHLPIGILDTMTSSCAEKLAVQYNCKTSFIDSNALILLGKNNFSWLLDIKFAFVTIQRRLIFLHENSTASCYKFQDNKLCDGLKADIKFDCGSIYSDMSSYRRPFEQIVCDCGVTRAEIQVEGSKSFNLFYIDQYPAMSQKCFENEIFDSKSKKCRKTGCFSGKRLVNGQCLHYGYQPPPIVVNNQSMVMKGYTLPLIFTIPGAELINENIVNKITDDLESVMSVTFNFTATLCHTIIKNGQDIQFIVQVDTLIGENRSSAEKNLQQFVSYLLENPHKLHNFSVSLNSKTNDFIYNNGNDSTCSPGWRPLLSKMLSCRHVIYNVHEYEMTLQTARIKNYRNKFDFHEYYRVDGKLMVCMEDFLTLKEVNQPEIVSYVVLIVCNMLSFVFLVLTIFTYCLFSSLRTVPGKIIMNLSFSLMWHYVTFILIMVRFENNVLCPMLGILAHYFFLTSIGSLFVCAWHMFRIFGTSSLASSMAASQNDQASKQYVLFTYLYALIIVILNVVVNIVVTSGSSIGYGERACFLSNKESILISLVLPLLVLSSADIVLYTVTVYRLRQRPKKDNEDNAKKKDLIIFAKLFVTTGCSWILLIVNVFVDGQILSITISCINSIQGVFIFMAYIFNKRICDMYKSKIRPWTGGETSVNRSPSTSMSSLSRVRTNLTSDLNTPFLRKHK